MVSAEQQGRAYFYDHSCDGGIVHSHPLRTPEPLTVAKGTRLPTPEEVLRGAKVTDFARSSQLRGDVRSATRQCRSDLLKLMLSGPGFINFGDESNPIYTGWFWVVDKNGYPRRYGVGQKFPLPKAVEWVAQTSPYWIMDEVQAKSWQDKAGKGLLSKEDLVELANLPHEDVYSPPDYLEVPVSRFLREGMEFTNSFFAVWRRIKEARDESELVEHLRSSLLRLVLTMRLTDETYANLKQFVVTEMGKIGTRFLEDPEGGCVVSYIGAKGNLIYRALPLPLKLPTQKREMLQASFQGAQPLTYKEAEVVYKAWIDPNTKLFD